MKYSIVTVVAAFSVIVQPVMEPMDRFTALDVSLSTIPVYREQMEMLGLYNNTSSRRRGFFSCYHES